MEKRPLIITLLAVLLICGTCGAVALVGLRRASVALTGSVEWSDDAVGREQVLGLYGVTLPATVLAYRSRAIGIQEWRYEVLARLPPGEKQTWLDANHLAPAKDSLADVDEVEEEIRRTSRPAGTARVTPLEGPERHATLLEYDDQCWLYLDQ